MKMSKYALVGASLLFLGQSGVSFAVDEVVVIGNRHPVPDVTGMGIITPPDSSSNMNRETANQAQAAAAIAEGRVKTEVAIQMEKLKAKCLANAEGYLSGCRSGAASARARDIRACSSIPTSFSGQLQLSVGIVTLTSGFSPEALYSQCKDIADAVMASNEAGCLAQADQNRLKCLEI